MRVALIAPGGFAPPGRKREIPALIALMEELARRHSVEVFVTERDPEAPDRYQLLGAEVHQLGPRAGARPPTLPAGVFLAALVDVQRALSAASAREPFDVVHAFWADRPGCVAALLKPMFRLPLVVSVAGGELVWLPEIGYGGAGTVRGRLRSRLALRQADAVTIGSAFARGYLEGRERERVEIVPLGIRSAWLERPSPPRPPGPPYRLLHVGSLNRVKDHATLLDAFASIVRQTSAEVTLDCAGEDVLGGTVQARARALGLADRARFHGFVPNERLGPFYERAHLLLLSSRYESQCVAVLEAAATGLPTVGTAVGLLPSLAPDAAAVVPVGDAAALARETQALLLDEPRRLAMGERARRFAQAHDVRSTARAFEAIYERLSRQRSK